MVGTCLPTCVPLNQLLPHAACTGLPVSAGPHAGLSPSSRTALEEGMGGLGMGSLGVGEPELELHTSPCSASIHDALQAAMHTNVV
jgi:hypothetical protein